MSRDRELAITTRFTEHWSEVDVANAPNTPGHLDRCQRYHVLMEDGCAACDRTMLLADSPGGYGTPDRYLDVLGCRRPGCARWRGTAFTHEQFNAQRKARIAREEAARWARGDYQKDGD